MQVILNCRPPDCSVVQAAASRPRHFRAHQTQTALLRAYVAFASALRYRGLSAHGVSGSGTASRRTLLPQVCHDTVFLEDHLRLRDVLWGLAPPRGSLGGNAVFTSRRSVRVQWMTSSTFSLSQQDNKCLGAPSRESHTPQETQKKGVTAMQSLHVHQQVGQSQENQRAQRLTLKTCEEEKHHPGRYATKNFMPPHCQFLTSSTTLRELIHCTPTHTLL